MKKAVSILLKIATGLVFLYLFVAVLLLPSLLAWAIKDQGQKILHHQVKLKAVSFNPFLWRLNIEGLNILDSKDQSMLSFNRLLVDVSFKKLLRREYRVESVLLDGLTINALLMKNGHLNLLDLVPANKESQLLKQPETSGAAKASGPTSIKEMPKIYVDDILVSDMGVFFTDASINPAVKIALTRFKMHVTGLVTDPDAAVKIEINGYLDEKGEIKTEALVKPFAKNIELETNFSLGNYFLTALSSYSGKYTGRSLQNGRLDIKMDYRISNQQLSARHKLLVQQFEFGQTVESKDALSLPFGLILALLEDPQGRINIALPVKGDMSNPKFEYMHLIGQVISNFFLNVATKPFSFLGSILGVDNGEDELGIVRFVPGEAILSNEEKEKLLMLIKGFKERPKLLLEINGAYDPIIDWRRIKLDAFTREYEQLRHKSSKKDFKIYQNIYQRHFGIKALWQLAKSYKQQFAVYNEEKFNQEIKKRLIEDAPADKVALGLLAQARAQVIYDFLLANGFDSSKLSMGQVHEAQSTMGMVPLEFTLTTFNKK